MLGWLFQFPFYNKILFYRELGTNIADDALMASIEKIFDFETKLATVSYEKGQVWFSLIISFNISH